ncbi:hypothetical protein LTR37_003234 [Vermiconidia calcicola]|uniref:Uncharacterized protein n=1 Tax=Vermiconidia calcicola TaxID=1690605 RepID=A0ACC3NQW3_9PEZI|nr:hypothetical protein LTR37_003234 [Vermiconidia calcicola]
MDAESWTKDVLEPHNLRDGVPEGLRGLETEAIWAKGHEMQVVIEEKDVNIGMILPGINEHPKSFQSVQDAVAFLDEPKRQVNADVDDVEIVRRHFSRYRKRIYNAMVSLPDDVDAWQSDQAKRFVTILTNGQFTIKHIEAKSWILTEEVIKVQELGTSLTANSGATHPAFSQALDAQSLKRKRLAEFRRKDNLGIGARIKRSAGELTVLTEEQPASETTSAGHATATTANAMRANSGVGAQDQSSSSTTSLTSSRASAPVAAAIPSARGQALPLNFFAPTYGYGDLEDILKNNDLDE